MASQARRRPTLIDVARLSGVSTASVSYVLNDRADKLVSDQTRERILHAAAELGYVRNAAAATLSRGHTNVILLVTDDTLVGEVSARTIKDVTDNIRGLGYIVVVHTLVTDEVLLDVVAATQPFAVLLFSFVSELTRERLPTFGARHVLGVESLPSSASQGHRPWERTVGAAQVRHLAERGHTILAYAMPGIDAPRHPIAQSRYDGAVEECERLGWPPPVRLIWPIERTAIARALPSVREQGVTAICGHDDQMAFAILAAMADLRWISPHDLAVLGADNSPESALAIPPLSTVALATSDQGRWTAEWLRAVVAGKDSDIVPPPLIADVLVRGTT